jgi:hypothetical protein
MGPVVPFLSDSPAQLDAAVGQIAATGATHVMPIVLHLRPGTREWFFAWLRAQHPELVDRYLDLYGHGSYAPKAYQNRIAGQVRELAEKHGIGHPRPGSGASPRPSARAGSLAAAPGRQVLSAPRPPETQRPRWAAQPLTEPGKLALPQPREPRQAPEVLAARKRSRSPEPPEQLTLL